MIFWTNEFEPSWKSDKSDNALEFADNAIASFGTGADLTISHNGSNSIINDAGTGELQLQRGGSTVVALSSTGADLTGDLTASGKFIASSSSSGDYIRVYASSGTGKWDIYGSGANLRIGDNDSAGIFQVDSSVQFGDGGGFDMNINGTRHQFSIGGSEKMRITSDGALGIGTTSPDGRLHLVTGSTTDDAHVTFHASATSGTNNSGEVLKVISARGTGNTNPVFNVLTNSSTSVLSAHGNGNVGIGTTSPRALLDLGGGSGDGTISSTVSEYQLVCEAPQGTGDIGRNIAFAVTTNGISAAINSVDEGGSNATGIAFATGTAGSIAERMRIESDGDLLVSTTTGTLDIGGDSGAVISGSSGTHFFTRGNASTGGAVFWIKGGSGQAYVLGDGDLVNTNGNYDGISDQNLKENIVDANSQWDDIKALKVRNYNFKESTKYSTHKQIGVIAQELEASGMNGLVKDIEDTLYIEGDELPEGKNIGDVKEEGYKAVSYSVLYMKAIKALQEAMTKIETLETKVAALEAG